MPLGTHLDAFCTIVLVGYVTLILGSLVHHMPDALFPRIGIGVDVGLATTVRLRITDSREVVRAGVEHLVALVSTSRRSRCMTPYAPTHPLLLWDLPDDLQIPKPLPCIDLYGGRPSWLAFGLRGL